MFKIASIVFFYALICTGSAKKYLYCSDDYKLEPNLADIVYSLIGANVSIITKPTRSDAHTYESISELAYDSAREFSKPFLHSVFSQEIPLMKVISNGVFTIDWNGVDFDDVYILQQNHKLVSMLCDIIGSRYESLQTTVCRCWKGDYLSGKQLGFVAKNSYIDYSYCSYRPCTDSRIAMGDCHVTVDPFLHSCIQVYSAVESKISDIVRYESIVPTMTTAGSIVVAVAESFESLVKDIKPSGYFTYIISSIKLIGGYSQIFLNYTPKYLCNLVLGVVFFVNSEQLASSRIFQYTLAGSLGLVLALAWFLLTLYRMGHNMVKAYIPFPSTTFAVGIFASSYLFTNNDLRTFVLSSLWAFWDDGTPFGIKWIGKLYFLVTFIISVLITRIFGLFTPGSSSKEVLRYSLKIIAVLLLTHSSASQEIAAVIVACVVFHEDLQYYIWSTYLTTQAIVANPPKYYSGRQLSKKEFEVEGEEYTKKSLEQLKSYLVSHPDETNKYMDKFRESDKMTEAQVLLRFVHHGYSGRPSMESSLLNGRQYTFKWYKLGLVICLVICLAGIIYSTTTGSVVISKMVSRFSKYVDEPLN